MDDLISRQAALELVRALPSWPTALDNLVDRAKMQTELMMLPSAQRKGKWKRPIGAPRCSYRYECSECGEIAYQVTGNCGRKKKVPEPCCSYVYCPNCGAKMEEDNGHD